MNCKKMRLDAKPVREAMMFVEKGNWRPYLTGVYIEPDGQVTATDGHQLYTAKAANIQNEPKDFKGMILKVMGAIPRKARTLDLTLDKGEGFIVCRCAKGSEIKRFAAVTVEGKYPDYNQVFPDEKESVLLTNVLHLNLKYLKNLVTIFPDGTGIKFSGHNKPILFESLGDTGEGAPQVIIMGIRVD